MITQIVNAPCVVDSFQRMTYDNHSSHFTNSVLDYAAATAFADVEIVGNLSNSASTRDASLPLQVNSQVLASCSCMLRIVLDDVDKTESQPLILLPDYDQSSLKGLLCLLYRGSVNGSSQLCTELSDILHLLGMNAQWITSVTSSNEELPVNETTIVIVAASSLPSADLDTGDLKVEDDDISNDGDAFDSSTGTLQEISFESVKSEKLVRRRPVKKLVGMSKRTKSKRSKSRLKVGSSRNRKHPQSDLKVGSSPAAKRTRRGISWAHKFYRMSGVDPVRPFQCTFCNNTYKQKNWCVAHIRIQHVELRRFACTVAGCAKQFRSKAHMQRHRMAHGGERPFACSLCPDKTFIYENSLKKHMATHQPDTPFQCDKCEFKSKFQPSLIRHVATKHDSRVKSHLCQGCGKDFLYPSLMRKHMVSCKDSLQLDDELGVVRVALSSEKHASDASQQNGESSEVHRCITCERTYPTLSRLKVHQLNHTKTKAHACTECGKAFFSPAQLKVHELSHTNERPYACEKCPRTFNYKQSLKDHQVTHMAGFPYHCAYCGKGFNWKEGMEHHIRVHTGEKPFKCCVCGLAFSRPHNKTVHERTHRVYEFKCHLCKDSYKVKWNLEKHIKRKHSGICLPEVQTVVDHQDLVETIRPEDFLNIPVSKAQGDLEPLNTLRPVLPVSTELF